MKMVHSKIRLVPIPPGARIRAWCGEAKLSGAGTVALDAGLVVKAGQFLRLTKGAWVELEGSGGFAERLESFPDDAERSFALIDKGEWEQQESPDVDRLISGFERQLSAGDEQVNRLFIESIVGSVGDIGPRDPVAARLISPAEARALRVVSWREAPNRALLVVGSDWTFEKYVHVVKLTRRFVGIAKADDDVVTRHLAEAYPE